LLKVPFQGVINLDMLDNGTWMVYWQLSSNAREEEYGMSGVL